MCHDDESQGQSGDRWLDLCVIYCMSALWKEKASLESSKTFSARSLTTGEEGECLRCRAVREECDAQLSTLKDKAHQSFMQVLQIQQLHEEELAMLREQWQERQSALMAETQTLHQQQSRLMAELQLLQRNTKRHSCDFGRQLVIDNIQAILCEGEEASYLDESQLIQFKDIVSTRGGSAGEFVASLRREIYRDCKFVSSNKTQIEKLFVLIKELKEEVHLLQQTKEENTRRTAQAQAKASIADNQAKVARNSADTATKEIHFLSEQVKRLTTDKLRLQKRVGELERAGYSSPGNRQTVLPAKHGNSPLNRVAEQQRSVNLLEESRSSISGMRISELNYARFMMQGQADTILQPQQPLFKKKGSK